MQQRARTEPKVTCACGKFVLELKWMLDLIIDPIKILANIRSKRFETCLLIS